MVGSEVVFEEKMNGVLTVIAMDRLFKEDKTYVSQTLAGRPAPPQKQQPPPQAGSSPLGLEVTWTKEKTNSTSRSESGSSFVSKMTNSTFVVRIKMRNKSSQPMEGLELQYQLCTSSSEYSAYGNSNGGGKNVTLLKYRPGAIQCPSLAPGATATLDTKPFYLLSDDSNSNVGGTFIAANRRKDEFKGIIVTGKLKGAIVYEYVSTGIKKYP